MKHYQANAWSVPITDFIIPASQYFNLRELPTATLKSRSGSFAHNVTARTTTSVVVNT